MQSDLVSVIMPVYNGERFIRQAVESMLAQTYPYWELVVVDDGSTDRTASLIRSYPDSRIHYHFQENRGQAAALNRGLELAQGEFISTLDADDWLPPNSLADRAEFLKGNPHYDVVYGDGYYCDIDGKPILQFSQHMPLAGVTGDVFDMLIVSPFYGTGASVMIRRKALEVDRMRYDESIVWCQDWDFYIRLAATRSFGFVPGIMINYRLHEAGMTASMPTGRRLESLLRLRKEVLTSQRFQSTPVPQKIAFFYDYLVGDLNDRIEDQTEVFESEFICALPSEQQSRLLRLAANNYLLQNKHLEIARGWLRKAWRLSPLNLKTIFVYLASVVNPHIARVMVQIWQRRQGGQAKTSPFVLAGAYDRSIE